MAFLKTMGLFAFLLTLHPAATGWDHAGAAIALAGMALIVLQPSVR